MSTKKLTQEEFIKKCQEVLSDQLDFTDTVYVNTRSSVTVNCKIHGEFTKNARSLLNGVGCPSCSSKWKKYVQRQRLSNEEFISKATKIHNGFYVYTKTEYHNSRTKVTITCPIHGDFDQYAGGHLEGYGCQKCGNLKHGDYRPWLIKTYFNRYPEKINLPATLYLLYSREENFYKVGITTKESVNDRVKYMSKYNFEIVEFVADSLYNVAVAEQKILNNSSRYRPKKRFGGYTECIKNYVDIKNYLSEQGRKPYQGGMADNDICSD